MSSIDYNKELLFIEVFLVLVLIMLILIYYKI